MDEIDERMRENEIKEDTSRSLVNIFRPNSSRYFHRHRHRYHLVVTRAVATLFSIDDVISDTFSSCFSATRSRRRSSVVLSKGSDDVPLSCGQVGARSSVCGI